jgi:hypothetical protein
VLGEFDGSRAREISAANGGNEKRAQPGSAKPKIEFEILPANEPFVEQTDPVENIAPVAPAENSIHPKWF